MVTVFSVDELYYQAQKLINRSPDNLLVFDKPAVCVDIGILAAFEKLFSALLVSCENKVELAACGFEILCKNCRRFFVDADY